MQSLHMLLRTMATDTQCLTYQIPGGMLSNLLSQLKMMNALDKFDEALLETPKVREDMGYPPLVTPTSQIVGTQAVQNVLAGERYHRDDLFRLDVPEICPGVPDDVLNPEKAWKTSDEYMLNRNFLAQKFREHHSLIQRNLK